MQQTLNMSDADAEPALPSLGSALLQYAESNAARRGEHVSCGSTAIDEQALAGGLRYGEVTVISGEDGTSKDLV